MPKMRIVAALASLLPLAAMTPETFFLLSCEARGRFPWIASIRFTSSRCAVAPAAEVKVAIATAEPSKAHRNNA